jgi:CheY-like chemotaxis protein
VRIGHRILVAEDQQVNWLLIERMLSKRGHSAVNATDGRTVLGMLESDRYDLVFMDCQMPVLDGYDTAREIRRREAGGERDRVPIVAMTANAMLGDRERCLAAGMDDYIPKPINPELLDEVLARWLTPAPEATQVLDQARLAELRSLFSREEMSGMLQSLAAMIATEVAHIGKAATDGDCDTLAFAAHRVKNNAGMIGATALAGAAARLQSQADTDGRRSQPLDETAIQTLVDHWHVTRTAIESELAHADHAVG